MPITAETIEAEIFCRVFASRKDSLPPEVANYLLSLRFSDDDLSRMHELAQKNREVELSDEEARELDAFILTGDVLALLQSQARKTLDSRSGRRNRRG
jgi:hypothetical protein